MHLRETIAKDAAVRHVAAIQSQGPLSWEHARALAVMGIDPRDAASFRIAQLDVSTAAARQDVFAILESTALGDAGPACGLLDCTKPGCCKLRVPIPVSQNAFKQGQILSRSSPPRHR